MWTDEEDCEDSDYSYADEDDPSKSDEESEDRLGETNEIFFWIQAAMELSGVAVLEGKEQSCKYKPIWPYIVAWDMEWGPISELQGCGQLAYPDQRLYRVNRVYGSILFPQDMEESQAKKLLPVELQGDPETGHKAVEVLLSGGISHFSRNPMDLFFKALSEGAYAPENVRKTKKLDAIGRMQIFLGEGLNVLRILDRITNCSEEEFRKRLAVMTVSNDKSLDLTKQDVTKKGVAKEDVTKQVVATTDVAKKGITKQDFVKKRVAKQDVAKKDVAKQDVSKQDVSKKDVAKQDVSKQDVSKKDGAKKNVAKQDVGKKDVDKNDVAKKIVKQDVRTADVAKKRVAKNDVIKQDVSTTDVAKEDVDAQDVAKKNVIEQDATKENVTKKDTTKNNVTTKVVAKKDVAKTDIAKKDDDKTPPKL